MIEFVVQRYLPGAEPSIREQRYDVPVQPGMTVLSGLLYIRENIDPTLGFRYSCRMSVCGACAMLINGVPALACNTQVLDVASDRITLRGLANFAVQRDLAVDFEPMFARHRAVRPFVSRQDSNTGDVPDGEYRQSPEELIEFLQFAECIKCGACMSVCPTLASDDEFAGPMPLAAAHRYNADTRDDGFDARMTAVNAGSPPWHCHYAAECSRVCPKGVDPARAIQLLKRDIVLDALHLKAKHVPANTLAPAPAAENTEIGGAPPFTVDR